MISVDLPSASSRALKAIRRAVYVVKCTNRRHPNLYSCGAAGVRPGQNGNLLQRLDSHARNRSSSASRIPKPLFRHRASPFGGRVWALHLDGWSPLGVQLAEHALHFRLGLAFPFVDDSCFPAGSDAGVLEILEEVVPDLRRIAAAGNSTAHGNGTPQGPPMVPRRPAPDLPSVLTRVWPSADTAR